MISLAKKSWSDVRLTIRKLNRPLFEAIEEANPGDDCFFLEAEYHYGDLMLNKGLWHLPTEKGELIRLNDPKVPESLQKELHYNMYTNPAFIVLDKHIECFLVPFTEPYTGFSLRPGQVVGVSGVLSGLPPLNAIKPLDSVWHMSSGARNTFLTAKLTDAAGNRRLHRSFDLRKDKPTSPTEHWEFFRDIHRQMNRPWKSKILMFSRNWFKHLEKEKSWRALKIYFYQQVQDIFSFWSNSLAWNMSFSQINFLKNIDGSSLSSLVTKHVMGVATGKLIGFAPAINDSHLPARMLTEVYTNIYEMKDSIPIIMHPEYLDFSNPRPVYVSLQRLNMEEAYLLENVPSTLKMLDEVQYTLNKYLNVIKHSSTIIDAPMLGAIADQVKFDFFHSVKTQHSGIKSSQKLSEDPAFQTFRTHRSQSFPHAGNFFRGCIRLKPIILKPEK